MTTSLLVAAGLLAGPPCSGQEASASGPVARFALDEGAGSTVRDTSGNGGAGRVEGAAWVRAGRTRALSFDGTDDYVDAGAPAGLDLRGPMTLSAWVCPAEVPQGEVGIAGKHFTSYLLTYYWDRKAYWYIGSGGNHVAAHVVPGAWSHLAGTFDGRTLRLYVNGEPAGERQSSFESTPPGRSFFIGSVLGDPQAEDPAYTRSGFFSGSIADVCVYSRALTPAEIGAQCAAGRERRFAAAGRHYRVVRHGPSVSAGPLTAVAGRTGAVEVRTDAAACLIESTFSYPGQEIGRNAFGEAEGSAEPAWRPAVERAGRDTLRLAAAGASYRVERVVRVRKGRVEVEDSIRNLTNEPLGVLVRQSVTTPEALASPRLGMGADEPLVFGSTSALDLGVVAEDEVSRAQFAPFCAANRVGFRLDHFGLAPRAQHTFRWAVYLLPPTGTPWPLINRVRDDWGANHTILGPASFFDATDPILADPPRLEAYLERRRLGIAMLSPWLDYDPGTLDHVLRRDEYRTLMQRAMGALKAADPRAKCIGCIETDWVTIDPARLEGGDRLPTAGPGRSGPTRIGPDLAGVLEGSGLPWLDSLKRDAEGGALLELYMRGGKPQVALGVYPAPGNHQARFLLDQARFLVEEVGLDGFYIDEFSLFWVKSHDRWDGTTVDMDPRTGRITGCYTDAGLAGIQPRRALCEYALRPGLVMVANTFATTAWENRAPIQRFAETWSNFDVLSLPATGKPPLMPELARGQLGTPIGLGALAPQGRVNSAELLMRALVLYLRHGMVYYHYFYGDVPESGEGSGEYGPINHMFPLTPLRLFEGGLEGRERTITCISGTYSWRGRARPTVLVFGPDGRPVAPHAAVRRAKPGWVVDLQLTDWTDIAVIEG